MNELILDTQENVEAKEEASKEKARLLKKLRGETHIDRVHLYQYSDCLYYYGMGWSNNNPLELIKEEPFKDRTSSVFIKLLNLITTLRKVDDVELLKPYLDAMKANGIEINILPHDKLSSETKEYIKEQMELVEEQQHVICENADMLKNAGLVAEEDNFCTKGKFKELTESYYKIQNSIKSEKVITKLSNDVRNNVMNNSGISEIIGK